MYPFLFESWIGQWISTFGIMVALGFLVGGNLAARSFDKAGLRADDAWNLLMWCLIGGLLGAKLWFVAEAVARHPGVPVSNFLLSRGGLTWYGGLVGGAVLGVVGAVRMGLPLKTAMDASAPTLAIGQAIGRIGCFLVGDDWGAPTDLPWGVAFPKGIDPVDYPVHPTQIYESVWLFAGTWWLWRRRGRSPFLFGEYLLIQGAGRFAIEFVRKNPGLFGDGLITNAQVFAVVLIAAGTIAWIAYARSASDEPATS